ncbi:MAG TPA: efflux RND transporter periplasmic adaptor subunit [Steroidobacteraceae bacterium]|nr:efflux RND transporter periplasmic adaptor subunit [Steroidobacteraceae bacterium]
MRIAAGRACAAWAAVAATLMAGIGIATPAAPQASPADGPAVTVREHSVTAEYRAYAQVLPLAVVPVRAVGPGTVAALRVEPGSQVTAGEPLATLSGPEIQAALAARRGAVRSARARLTAARRALQAERRQLAGRLSTRQSVAAAESAVAAAAADLTSAQAQLQVAQQTITLRAPVAGTVIAVDAGSGERVTSGQSVLTLQARGSLWLVATCYGRDAAAVRAGMHGSFEPASGGKAVRVRVASVFPALAPDGGEKVGLLPAGAGSAEQPGGAPWLDGEWGTVILAGARRRVITVPTAALIMDRAQWWVLVRTPSGDRARPVVPGPARGWDSIIEKGLEPGQRVVVRNAYLEYHRGISRRYTPPD